jgi:hypothetical protein
MEALDLPLLLLEGAAPRGGGGGGDYSTEAAGAPGRVSVPEQKPLSRRPPSADPDSGESFVRVAAPELFVERRAGALGQRGVSRVGG